MHMQGLDSDVEDAASEEMETRGMLSSYLLDPIVEAWMSDPETLGLPDPASSSQVQRQIRTSVHSYFQFGIWTSI